MKRLLPIALFVAFAALFLIANRAAYQGYFQDDELDNLGWTNWAGIHQFTTGLATPAYSPNNFRPVGAYYFWAAGRLFGLHFAPYVAILHAIHLLNVILVWLVLRRFDFDLVPAAFGTLLFGFHMAVFDVYWKPMYVFDLYCATFAILSLLLWMRGRWILSFVAFWFAYKSKEHAIALPVALAGYEYFFGQPHGKKRYKQLIPFFAVSLSFGVQAMLFNHNANNAYALRFAPAGMWKAARFYADLLLLIPFAGFAVAAAALFFNDKRYRFGVAFLALLIAPMLAVPGRLFAAYWYVALAGFAIAAAAAAAKLPIPAVIAAAIAWIPFQHYHLREQRRAALTVALENRLYVEAVQTAQRTYPKPSAIIFEGRPTHMARWGVEGAMHYVFKNGLLPVLWIDEVTADKPPDLGALVLSWDAARQKMLTHVRGDRDASYFPMTIEDPIWQLGKGWLGREGSFRWAQLHAVAYLLQPAGARQFEVIVNAGGPYINAVKKGELEVLIDDKKIGAAEFTKVEVRKLTFDVAPGPGKRVKITLLSRPGVTIDGFTYGTPIGGFGFR